MNIWILKNFNKLKDNHIRFIDALKKQQELLKK